MPDDTVVVTAIYGQPYLKYLPSLLASLWEQGHFELVIVTDGAKYSEIDELVAWASYEKDLNVTVTSAGEDEGFKRAIADKAPILAKLAAWRHGLRLATARKFVCLDVDTLVQMPLGRLFEEASIRPFNLAVPRSLHSSGRYLYRASLIAGIATSAVDRELDDWLREALMLNRVERRTIVDLYGDAIAAAFTKIVSKSEDSGTSILAYLPGKTWCAEMPPFDGSCVVHFRHSPIPPRDGDPTWASMSTDWNAMREKYFQRIGKAVARSQTQIQTLTEGVGTKEAT